MRCHKIRTKSHFRNPLESQFADGTDQFAVVVIAKVRGEARGHDGDYGFWSCKQVSDAWNAVDHDFGML